MYENTKQLGDTWRVLFWYFKQLNSTQLSLKKCTWPSSGQQHDKKIKDGCPDWQLVFVIREFWQSCTSYLIVCTITHNQEIPHNANKEGWLFHIGFVFIWKKMHNKASTLFLFHVFRCLASRLRRGILTDWQTRHCLKTSALHVFRRKMRPIKLYHHHGWFRK